MTHKEATIAIRNVINNRIAAGISKKNLIAYLNHLKEDVWKGNECKWYASVRNFIAKEIELLK